MAEPRQWLPWTRRSRRAWQNSLQGLLLLLGGAGLLVLYLGAMGGSRHWWRPALDLEFHAATAAGLQPGMQVRISGIPVGRVRSLELLPDARVRVRLSVGLPYQGLIGRTSLASLAQDSLLASPYVAIQPEAGRFDGDRQGGRTIVYRPPADLQAMLSDVAALPAPLRQALGAGTGLAARRIPASLDALDRTLATGRQAVGSLQRDAGSLQRDLGRSSAAVTASATAVSRGAAAVSQAADQVRSSSQSASRLLRDTAESREQLLPVLLQTLRELHAITGSTNQLMQRLQGSWLLELLAPASDRPAPATSPPAASPPGQTGAVEGASR